MSTILFKTYFCINLFFNCLFHKTHALCGITKCRTEQCDQGLYCLHMQCSEKLVYIISGMCNNVWKMYKICMKKKKKINKSHLWLSHQKVVKCFLFLHENICLHEILLMIIHKISFCEEIRKNNSLYSLSILLITQRHQSDCQEVLVYICLKDPLHHDPMIWFKY